jgi:hypothetical protein
VQLSAQLVLSSLTVPVFLLRENCRSKKRSAVWCLLSYTVLDRALCRKIIGKVLAVTTATQYSRQRCSRRNRAGNSVKSAVQTRVVLLIESRLHATYTLQSLLVNYKLEAAGESCPNFLRAVIRKWGHCTVNGEDKKVGSLHR